MQKILKFYANWCGPCKTLTQVMETVDLNGIELESIDIEENQELADKYGVRSIPLLVMINAETGTELKALNGLKTKEQITEWLNV